MFDDVTRDFDNRMFQRFFAFQETSWRPILETDVGGAEDFLVSHHRTCFGQASNQMNAVFEGLIFDKNCKCFTYFFIHFLYLLNLFVI